MKKSSFRSRMTIRFAGAAMLTAAAFAPAVSGAQEFSAELLAAARAAVEASRSTVTMDVILPNMGETAKQQLIDSRPDQAEQINDIVNEATLELAPRRGDLEDEVARIYARVFTVEELKQIAEFYNTDAGKKLIRETPVIARSMEEASRIWGTGVQRDLQQAITKKMEAAGLQ